MIKSLVKLLLCQPTEITGGKNGQQDRSKPAEKHIKGKPIVPNSVQDPGTPSGAQVELWGEEMVVSQNNSNSYYCSNSYQYCSNSYQWTVVNICIDFIWLLYESKSSSYSLPIPEEIIACEIKRLMRYRRLFEIKIPSPHLESVQRSAASPNQHLTNLLWNGSLAHKGLIELSGFSFNIAFYWMYCMQIYLVFLVFLSLN